MMAFPEGRKNNPIGGCEEDGVSDQRKRHSTGQRKLSRNGDFLHPSQMHGPPSVAT